MPGEVKIEIRIDERTKEMFKALCEIQDESMTDKLLRFIDSEVSENEDEIEKYLKREVGK